MSEPAGDKPLRFEEAVERLEEIVAALESGGLPLEESLRRYEEAVRLSRLCGDQLDRAGERLRELDAPAGQARATDAPWETGDDA